MSFIVKNIIKRPSKNVPFFSKFIEKQTTSTPEKLALQSIKDEREKLGFTETTTPSADGLTLTNEVDYGTEANYNAFNQTYAQALATVKTVRTAYEKASGITRIRE